MPAGAAETVGATVMFETKSESVSVSEVLLVEKKHSGSINTLLSNEYSLLLNIWKVECLRMSE